MPITQDLIDAFIQAMSKQNVSQHELARRTGITQKNISGILAGKKGNVEIKTLDRLAAGLGKQIDMKLKRLNCK